MTLVVILTVRTDALESFRDYERSAARVMARYCGAIERAVGIPAKPGEASFREVQIVTFAGAAAFEAYRMDGEIAALAPLREISVLATEIMIGEDGPEYSQR